MKLDECNNLEELQELKYQIETLMFTIKFKDKKTHNDMCKIIEEFSFLLRDRINFLLNR